MSFPILGYFGVRLATCQRFAPSLKIRGDTPGVSGLEMGSGDAPGVGGLEIELP